MLRTNSKKARENIQNYIIDNFTPYSEDEGKVQNSFEAVASYIFSKFWTEYRMFDPQTLRYYGHSEATAFESWASGLPSILDTCYYYNRSAVDDLGNILEQTKEQRNKYDERAAERLLTSLIYREIKRGCTQ